MCPTALALRPEYTKSILAITWSLAVEEQFYFIWPLTLFFLLRTRISKHWVVVLILGGLALVIIHRALLLKSGAPFYRLYYATDTRADGLLLGCLLGCLVSWGLLPKSRLVEIGLKVFAALGVVFLSYLVLTFKSNNPSLFKGVFTMATLAIVLVLTVLVVWPESSVFALLKLAPLVWVGRISYGLYLWHWPVRGLVYGSVPHPSVRQVVMAVVLSFAITSLSFYLVERPFLAWKKRLSHA